MIARRIVTVPEILVLTWIVLVGAGMAMAAAGAVEPPSHDTLSYTVKAFGFWDGVTHGRMVNPLGLGPNVRPPGTIFVSFPFGFSLDFRWYYFRTCFMPLILLAAAVYVVGYEPIQTRRQRWILAALAVALGNLPTLYQFQRNDLLPASSFWGLVDNFIAGSAAVAMAAVIRGAWNRSWGWTLFGALAASFCLMVKPSGIIVMGLAGVTWLSLVASQAGWRVVGLRADPMLAAYARKSFVSAAAVYAVILAASFLSPYFSPANIAYGTMTLSVIGTTGLSVVRLEAVRDMLHVGPGYVVLAVIFVGLIAAFAHRTTRIEGLLAILCLVAGGMFWLGAVDQALVRYVLPFVTMAFITVTPSLLAYASRPSPIFALGTALSVVPTLIVAALLFAPAPSLPVQEALGVNLIANAYQPESDQGTALMKTLTEKNEPTAPVYIFHATSPLRNFTGSLMFPAFVFPGPKPDIRMPMDWQRPTAFRIEEMVTSRYIAFEPVTDAAARALALKSGGQIFQDDYNLMSALLTTATEMHGLCVVSETRVRLAEVCDPASFRVALGRFAHSYTWTQEFRAANGIP